MKKFTVEGNLVDIHQKEIYPAKIEIADGKILTIQKSTEKYENFILCGFIDAHIHIESSMLVPSEFGKIAVKHGTIATVSDPHEIANVLGVSGVDFMLKNAEKSPLKFNFGAPSCVPATSFETAGARIDAQEIEQLLANPKIKYLTEMMNYPGVIFGDKEVLAKIAAAKKAGKPIDGHAPALRGEDLKTYVAAGIQTDHECFTIEEAREKISLGMHILIREGSAAKNFEALIPLLKEFPEKIMFCSDDKHPDDLLLGHINQLVSRTLDKGFDLFDVLRAVSLNPVLFYKLDVGLLRQGDFADFIVMRECGRGKVLETYINGVLVQKNGEYLGEKYTETDLPNQFNCLPKNTNDFQIKGQTGDYKVIEAINGELITKKFVAHLRSEDGLVQQDVENDILKIAVINRYANEKPALGFIKNFGLKMGAIASSVAHDSHNIIAVGADDESICKVVNLLIENKGGVAAVCQDEQMVLPLPIAGIMTNESAEKVGLAYSKLDKKAKEMGSKLSAPYMSLSFMALLVIPELKMSDKGLFDCQIFNFTNLKNTL